MLNSLSPLVMYNGCIMATKCMGLISNNPSSFINFAKEYFLDIGAGVYDAIIGDLLFVIKNYSRIVFGQPQDSEVIQLGKRVPGAIMSVWGAISIVKVVKAARIAKVSANTTINTLKVPATLKELINMMNKRPNVSAAIAQGEDLLFLENLLKSDGSHMLTESGFQILLRPNATRWTAFHEWLHRYLELKNIKEFGAGGYTPGADTIIDDFLRRHQGLFRIFETMLE